MVALVDARGDQTFDELLSPSTAIRYVSRHRSSFIVFAGHEGTYAVTSTPPALFTDATKPRASLAVPRSRRHGPDDRIGDPAVPCQMREIGD